MKIFDSHTHLNMDELLPEADSYMKEQLSENFLINIVGTTLKTSATAIQQAHASQYAYASVGIHPKYTHELTDLKAAMKQLALLARERKVVAIGETGLDFSEGMDRNVQTESFAAHVELANELGLPLNIHSRNAYPETYEVLKNAKVPVIMHCFTGTPEEAAPFIARGYYLSIPGVITFKNASALRAAVHTIPLSQLLVESDAPFLAPHPFRGKTNYPHLTAETIKVIAELLQIDQATMADTLFENTRRVFNLV